MITYEVTAAVDPALVSRYEHYMQTRHIPDLLATGCFIAATFSRSARPGRYRIRYEAADEAVLERYLSQYATELRAHVDSEFPSGVTLSRENWHILRAWPDAPDASTA